MSNCDDCGDALLDPRDKNKTGWWRDRCLPCFDDATGNVTHRDQRSPEQWLADEDAPEGWNDE